MTASVQANFVVKNGLTVGNTVVFAANGTFISNLTSTGVASGTYGGSSQIPVITVGADGRLSTAANVSIYVPPGTAVFANSGQLSSNSTTGTGNVLLGLANTAVTPGTYGSSSFYPSITVDQYGRVTSATTYASSSSNTAIFTNVDEFTANGTGTTFVLTATPFNANNVLININGVTQQKPTFTLSGSTIILTEPPVNGATVEVAYSYNSNNLLLVANTTVTPGTYGGSTNIPVLVVNQYGQVTSASNTSIYVPPGTAVFANSGQLTSNSATGTGNVLLGLATVGTAGTYANANTVAVITTDAYGRVSAVTNTAIQIAIAQVTGLQGVTDSQNTNTTAAGSYANSAFVAANSAGAYANSAFAAANTAANNAVISGAYANSAFAAANSAGLYANSAFSTANSAGIYANGAYAAANASFGQANSAASYANSAFSTANSAGVYANGAYAAANAAFSTANNALPKAGGTMTGTLYVSNGSGLSINTTGSLVVGGDITTAGNLYISGNVVTTNAVSTLNVSDPIIYLAANNSGNAVDIGLVGHFVGQGNTSYSHYQHTGFVRDYNDNKWKLFSNVVIEPTTTVTFDGNTSYDTIKVGVIEATSSNINGYDLLAYSNIIYTAANSAGVYANGAYAVGNAAFSRANTSANNFVGTSGSATPTNGSLSFASTNGVTTTGSGNTVTINTPQDLRTTASPQFNVLYANTANIGNLSYTATGTFIVAGANTNNYQQVVLQNANTGTQASADFVVSNFYSTDGFLYGDFGINGSGFSGTGALGTANNVYLYASNTDLAIGTSSLNAIHFVVNGSGTDAMNINSSGVVTLQTALGISSGGTNASSFTSNTITYYNGSAMASLANVTTVGVYGNSTSIPSITVDGYGRVVAVSNNAVSTTINLSGTTGSGSVSGGGTLTFLSNNGVVVSAAGGSTLYINDPQDLRTTASPSFTALTVNTFTYVTSTIYTTGNVSQNTIDQFSVSTYRSAKYQAQMTSGSAYHMIELNVISDGTTPYLAQYGEIFTSASLGTFDVSITAGTLYLLFTPANAVTTVKLMRTAITV